MDELKKDIRDKKKLAALLGIEVDEEEIVKAASQTAERKQEEISREAEAVIAYGIDRRKMLQKECKNCGGVFAVSRANVSCCSDRCRAKRLEGMGIIWDWSKNPEARWEFREPLVVPPQVLQPLLSQLELLNLPVPENNIEVEEPPVVVEELTSESIDELLNSL